MQRIGLGGLAVLLVLVVTAASAQAPPPPAPLASPSRAETIEILRRADIEHCLPITLGTGAPTAVVRREGARWVIRRLTTNAAELARARQEALAGGGSWMPEDAWRHLRPGRIILEGASQAELAARIEAMTDWSDRHLGAEGPPPGGSRALRFCPLSPP